MYGSMSARGFRSSPRSSFNLTCPSILRRHILARADMILSLWSLWTRWLTKILSLPRILDSFGDLMVSLNRASQICKGVVGKARGGGGVLVQHYRPAFSPSLLVRLTWSKVPSPVVVVRHSTKHLMRISLLMGRVSTGSTRSVSVASHTVRALRALILHFSCCNILRGAKRQANSC